ncbi:MAG: hypothetical protein LBK83_10100 [Treponema sp.]|jgi:hypothetical protein|nr:hypothetical protein [Treponema sp.]
MRRQFYCFFLGVFALLGASCATGAKRSSFAGYPPLPFFWECRPGRINVTIDRVREEGIAGQIETIIQTWLDGNQNYDIKTDRVLFLDVTMEQRSFIRGAEFYNTIYISCVLRDGEGTVYARENEYTTGRRNLVVAPEQYRIMKRVMEKLLGDQEKRYRALADYNGKHEN